MYRFLLLACPLILLAGCGGGGGSSTPTPPANKSYSDPTFHFSIKYPATWKLPKKGGHYSTEQGVQTYILPFTVPGGAASAEVTISGRVNFPPFEDGKVSPNPNGGPTYFHYYHVTVDGIPAVRVERWAGKLMDEVDTFVNTAKYGYDIRMDTGVPPFPSTIMYGYVTLLKTITLPFS